MYVPRVLVLLAAYSSCKLFLINFSVLLVDNKRLGTVLKLAQDKIDELERYDKRSRSKKYAKTPGTGQSSGTAESGQSGSGKPGGVQS